MEGKHDDASTAPDAEPDAEGSEVDSATAEKPVAADDVEPPRKPRPDTSQTGDPFGAEPAWLQHGSAKRTVLGVTLTLALLAGVGAVGWVLFEPDEDDGVPGPDVDPPAGAACAVVEHDDGDADVETPSDLGSPPPRQTTTVTTNFGEVQVLMFGDVAPCAVSGFEYLAESGFHDDVDCHRMAVQPADPTMTLRCGDPAGDGNGGPGFRYRAEQAFTGTAGADYFALINDADGSTGSAFAFVRGESVPTGSLSVLGQVVEGFDVLDQIAATVAEPEYDAAPPEPVTVLDVEIEHGAVTLPPTEDPIEEEPSDGEFEEPGQGEDSELPGHDPSDLESESQLPGLD